jgi:hypothetical protein
MRMPHAEGRSAHEYRNTGGERHQQQPRSHTPTL